MSVTFEEVAVPKREHVGRPAAPNPYLDVVKALGPDSRSAEVARAFVLTSASKDEHKVDVTKARRQLGDAGARNHVTVGIDVVPGKDGKSSKITFWTRPRIKRERATEGQAASA